MTAATLDVRGVPIRATTLADLGAELEELIGLGQRGYVCCASVHLIETAVRDASVAAALAAATAVVPDGAPVAWVARSRSAEPIGRITGSDLFAHMCGRSRGRIRHFLYGSSPEVLAALRERMQAEFPGIEICGQLAPPFGRRSDSEWTAEIEVINHARPDVVWVGLGAPKQELWMHRSRPVLDAPLLIGVGAVFDFASGGKRRAPVLMRRVGLEWLHRLAVEPRRLWRRYLVTNTTFVVGLVRDCVARPAREESA